MVMLLGLAGKFYLHVIFANLIPQVSYEWNNDLILEKEEKIRRAEKQTEEFSNRQYHYHGPFVIANTWQTRFNETHSSR